MAFQHQKLKVYERSLDLVVELVRLFRLVMPGWSDLIDQLRRAGTSIVLNFAEGASEFRAGEKARFFRIAMRSCAECHAALDILVRVGALPREEVITAQELLEVVAAMLVAMCKQVESRLATVNSGSHSHSGSRSHPHSRAVKT